MCRMVIAGMERESRMLDASSEGGINIRLDFSECSQCFFVDVWRSGHESATIYVEIHVDNLESIGDSNAQPSVCTSSDLRMLEDDDWRRIKSGIDAPLTTDRASNPALSISNLGKHLRVIDVHKECVVYRPQSCDYVTLSYVWGSSEAVTSRSPLEATSENIRELEVPGNNLFKTIPTTVKDAMTACREIGKQFLWVDRLCILQDQASAAAIRDMGMIYANSVLTIIALDNEDAFEGLPGISRPVLLPLETRIPGWCLRQNAKKERTHGFKWCARGWTYQEEVFSRRKLYFGKYGPFFKKDTRTPAADIFSEIEDFSHRELTYSKDKLRAVEGMLTANCPQGHYFGLPLNNFEYAVLWTPSPNIDSERFSNSLPSWSWCSVRSVEYDRHAYKHLGVPVASWALPGTGAGGHGAMRILEHTNKLTSAFWILHPSTSSYTLRSDDYGWRTRVLLASIVLAWRLGSFDAPMPTEFSSLMSWDQCALLVYSKWRHYHEFWKASRNGDLRPIFEQECSRRRRLELSSEQSKGSLLVYTQVSRLQLDTKDTSPSSGPFALRSKGNTLLGWVIFDREQDARAHQRFGETGVEIIALSIAQATEDDMKHYRTVARDPVSDGNTEPDINAYDYQGTLIQGGGSVARRRESVILLNIMIIEELGEGHRRLGLGKGILQRWKEAESQFGVRVLN